MATPGLLFCQEEYNADRIVATDIDKTAYSAQRKVSFALKTNALYDVALIPNIEAEIAFGKYWSINGSFMFPWWLNKTHNSFAFQVLSGSLEGRFWLGNRTGRRVLTGQYIGAYVGTGTYDIQFRRYEGYQGELGVMGGLSYGYALPVINDHFSIEFSVSIGYFKTNYQKYEVVDNATILAYCYDGNYTWWGPTNAKISFVWILPFK